MKKLISTFLLIAAVTFAITGCGANSTKPDNNSQNGNRSFNRQDGQAINADIYGEVDTISGNNITLKLIQMPVRPSSNPDSKKPQGSSRPNNQGDWQSQYTGETQTITVSDNTSITTLSRDQNGSQTSNIKLSEIKAGDRLQVWYSDKEKKTVEKISVMPKRNMPSPTAK